MGNGSYEYVKVGSWIEDKFEINTDEIQLPGRMKTISSVCSKPCSPGYKVDSPLTITSRMHMLYYVASTIEVKN